MEELQKSLRNQYSNDNEAYKTALAENGINPSNSTGKVRGIQQAYYDGTIDKGTRDYMMADTIAKFARNTGRDIGNIGAQFTGGTVNNNFETSDWDKRNQELFKQQTSAEAASILNSDKGREATGQNLANEKSDKALAASRLMQKYKNEASAKAKEALDKGNKEGAALWEGIAGEYALLESGATSSIDKEEHIGNIIASLGTAVASGDLTKAEMMDYAKTLFAGIGGSGIDFNIDNPLAKDKTGNEALDAPTENDKNSNLKNMGISEDIRNLENDFNKSDPTGKGKIVRNLFQGAGGETDKFKLATLVLDGKIDPNADYNGVKGSKAIDEVIKYLDDEKFVNDLKHYTNMDPSSNEVISQRKQQVAYDNASKAASKLGIDLDNLSEEQKLMLVDMSKKSWGSKDDNARTILDYLGIRY